MLTKDFREQLSKLLGFSEDTLAVIDRSLADAGLRFKTKGRTPAKLSRSEAIDLFIGCMTAEARPTRAGEIVRKWRAAVGAPKIVDRNTDDTSVTVPSEYPELRFMEDGLDFKGRRVTGTSLHQELMRICDLMERGEVAVESPDMLDSLIEFRLSSHAAVVHLHSPSGQVLVSEWFNVPKGKSESAGGRREVVTRVPADVLHSIAKWTAKPVQTRVVN
jgi:hypothetical protein